MNVLQLYSSNPVLAVLFPILGAAIPMTLLFSYTGLGFMIGTLQIKGIRTGRSAYDKAARQLAVLALLLGWALLVVSRIWIFFKSDGYVPQSFLATMVELSWGIFGFAVIASSIHFAMWKPLANHRGIHAFLGFFAGLNGTFALFVLLGALRLVTAVSLPNAAELSLYDLFNFRVIPSPLVNAAALVLPLSLALPASAALVWLIVRRNKDDFGRDYYNTMLSWCGRWGMVAWGLVTVLFLVSAGLDIRPLLDQPNPVPPQELAIVAVRVLLPLIICATMAAVGKSTLPMRLKPWMILAFFLGMPSAYFVFKWATSF